MLHQWIVDHIEYCLVAILAAQAIIFYGQSKIYNWADKKISDIEGEVNDLWECIKSHNNIFSTVLRKK